jgi:formylglycine-generating enzyme required for sulfatase activity
MDETQTLRLDESERMPAPSPVDGMVRLEGGTFLMGSNDHYPEEHPAHRVTVDGFWIDPYPVTTAQFATFVEATNYVTVAERIPNAADYPGAKKEMLVPASLVFTKPHDPIPPKNFYDWWRYVTGADWRHPRGPNSSSKGREQHPVVHVAFEDAQAYATWAAKMLPTEAEWEFAARGGLENAPYAWGEELTPGGKEMANYWQGEFPWQNLKTDGFEGTSPVGSFPANGYGLFDMIGNVWEWTTDWYSPKHPDEVVKACCIPQNPRGGSLEASYDQCDPRIRIGRKVLKGGSHLCAPNYCRRYRPAARYPEPVDTSTCHVGFRCIVRDAGRASAA